jgi:cytochrome c peroxidase
MRSRPLGLSVALCVLSATTFICLPAEAARSPDAASVLAVARGLFEPLPSNSAREPRPIPSRLVRLGRDLFFDTRLSADGTVSCARCHRPALYGSDGLPTSRGVDDRVNPRHAPTVLNAALQFRVLWRGEQPDVESQAMRAFLGSSSFGNPSEAAVITRLDAIPGYAARFEEAFPDQRHPVTLQNMGRAIGAYERTLVTPAPFDAFLRGDTSALSRAQVAGLRTFIATGCAACHNGVDVGGNSYRKFGITREYWKATGSKVIDKGRFDVTHDPKDLYVFKVPTLRNVAMVPPYFHDGTIATLAQAVRVMGELQLGKKLTDTRVSSIVSFLGSLTGPLPADFASVPVLPPGPFSSSRASLRDHEEAWKGH